jgi:NAD(P)-dependent dehydrogenase (short-subunit alcohol dehydrogenase family)
MGRLEGKNAFVTGAGGGIGRAIAVAFARAGANVAVVDNNERLARETAAALDGGRGSAQVCDVADRQVVFAGFRVVQPREGAPRLMLLLSFARSHGRGIDQCLQHAAVFWAH